MTRGKTSRGIARHNGRFYLVGGTEGKNRSKSGVWDICSYESLRPIDSSSQSGNFLSRLQIEYNSFPEFSCSVARCAGKLGRASGCGKGEGMGVRKFGLHLIRFMPDHDRPSKSPRLQSQRYHPRCW